jgi:hypothetical protein
MNRGLRIFLSILSCLIFVGFSIATFSLETLIALHDEDMTKYKSYDAYFYIVWHFMLLPVLGAWIPWIAWYRSPHNPQNHSSAVNKTNTSGQTLLHLASSKGNMKHVELLISNGADINAKQKYGNWTPLDLANYEKKNKVADLLRKHGAKTGEELKAEGK